MGLFLIFVCPSYILICYIIPFSPSISSLHLYCFFFYVIAFNPCFHCLYLFSDIFKFSLFVYNSHRYGLQVNVYSYGTFQETVADN